MAEVAVLVALVFLPAGREAYMQNEPIEVSVYLKGVAAERDVTITAEPGSMVSS